MKKNKKSVISAEELAKHPLVQASQELTTGVNEQKKHLQDSYTYLAENPADRSHDGDFRYEIQAMKLAAKEMKESHRQTASMADELEARMRDADTATRKRWLRKHPTNATVDWRERDDAYYARGLNGNKLRMICVMGSIFGVVVELLWCLLRNGYLESRSGLVWGPFNLVYGMGALVLTICLYRYRNRCAWLSFLGGMVVGSVVEYACSWIQETCFGSVSWDYSQVPFNLNGRICLLYSVFWGLLGVIWIKNIYPRMADLLLKIPNKAGRILSWTLAIFLAVNALVSGVAVLRWSQRVHGEAKPGVIWSVIDERFPDERMERIYANMDFGEND